MSGTHTGKWYTFGTHLYYLLGLSYYFYAWILALGGFGAAGAIVASTISDSRVIPGVLAGGAVGCIVLGVSFWRKTRTIQFSSKNPALKIQRCSIYYEMLNDTSCVYTRTVVAKVMSPTDHYLTKFYWTGQGAVTAETLNGANKVEIAEDHASYCKICRVYFPQPAQKGAIVTFSYRLKLEGAKEPIKPYLGFRSETPVPNLEMSVRFPTGKKPSKYSRQIVLSTESQYVLYTEDVIVEEPWTGLAEWKTPVNHPNVYYRIVW